MSHWEKFKPADLITITLDLQTTSIVAREQVRPNAIRAHHQRHGRPIRRGPALLGKMIADRLKGGSDNLGASPGTLGHELLLLNCAGAIVGIDEVNDPFDSRYTALGYGLAGVVDRAGYRSPADLDDAASAYFAAVANEDDVAAALLIIERANLPHDYNPMLTTEMFTTFHVRVSEWPIMFSQITMKKGLR